MHLCSLPFTHDRNYFYDRQDVKEHKISAARMVICRLSRTGVKLIASK